jgi:hypothetical protein
MADVSTEIAIATTTLSSVATTIVFNSIPATYTDLRLVFRGLPAGGFVGLRLNGDTGNNYSTTLLYADGSTLSSTRYSNNNSVVLGDNVPYITACLCVADIFSYAGSTYKTVLTELNDDYGSGGYIERDVSLWRNTAAITSLTIWDGGSNFSVGTTATLYGIL